MKPDAGQPYQASGVTDGTVGAAPGLMSPGNHTAQKGPTAGVRRYNFTQT